jgi:hypothetical protein
VEIIAAGPQSLHEILERSTDAAPQQAIHHVFNDLDDLKVVLLTKRSSLSPEDEPGAAELLWAL